METVAIFRSCMMVKHIMIALKMDGIGNGAVWPLVMTMIDNGEIAQLQV